ncbi:TetR family transcriptional regulator [Actinocatenispora thailandica]|uniref:TetR family transcriptional regulator n=1 Tax=Actinocatenispora thailandica TaxID=227318 RepID=A0A7R7DN48_9ACTN|nr:TetR/AcrR family transcriptional regulator [Actinocatenispora thailandica]BCJ34755.1 TetR family transcriptional regulator [Actinocatenispora thailandica]
MPGDSSHVDAGPTRRPHTGRRRNEAARRAILAAALRAAARSDAVPTVDAIAAEAGVGKQTIYRWWSGKHAVLLEALADSAAVQVPAPDTGTLLGDLTAFLTATFRGAGRPPVSTALRALAVAAQRTPDTATALRGFVEARREALRALLVRGVERAELPAATNLDVLVDQAYGLLWYRLLLGHAPLTDEAAASLAASLAGRPASGE